MGSVSISSVVKLSSTMPSADSVDAGMAAYQGLSGLQAAPRVMGPAQQDIAVASFDKSFMYANDQILIALLMLLQNNARPPSFLSGSDG